jgi:4-diphosphocytidyl-2-C-methyl-D-erythritol kinase
MSAARQARVRALAKINLDLRVLGKRPDGYHELRTIFQTISLGDTIEIQFTPGRKADVQLEDPLAISDNLVLKAARLVMESAEIKGQAVMRLTKKIPMGAGLGGGSSDAAAVLLALPVLAGRVLSWATLSGMALTLGSDVPFFLSGGTAVGVGRGAEIFPLPDEPSLRGVLVAPPIHISTAEAYRRLTPRLTTESQQNKIFSFQSIVWNGSVSKEGRNDFEAVLFDQHKRLRDLKRKLLRAGASHALMTGSGSAVFGLFLSRDELENGLCALEGENRFRISLVNRSRYRTMWWRALKEHIDRKTWPPPSRYAR